jgi:nitrous oxidase accessory protein NosD
VKKTSLSIRVVSVFVSFLILALSFSTSGATLKVCKIGCAFSSIEAAINSAASGDTVKVQNGNYPENLTIDKDVTLVGSSSRWVRITPSSTNSPAIVVGPSSATVKITNLTVIGEAKQRPVTGVTVMGDAELTMENSRVNTFQNGLIAKNSSNLKVRNSELVNSGTGVTGFDKSKVILSDSRVTSADTGLLTGDSARITLVETEITNCSRNAVLAKGTAKVNTLSSNFSNNRAPGVVIRDFSRLNMEDSQVSSNEGGGLLVKNSAIANLKNNQITYNERKNVSIISKKCGFSGPSNLFFGEVNGAGNEIKPAGSTTICPSKFSRITSSRGGSYSYPFKPSTYAFIGLVGVAIAYFLISR